MPRRMPAPTRKTTRRPTRKFSEEPPLSVTQHSITVGGKTLVYHATAGFIVLKEEEGKPLVKDSGQRASQESKSESKPDTEPPKTKDGLKPKAKVFFVAYTLDGIEDPATRPVTFAFNAAVPVRLAAHGFHRAAPRESHG